MDNLRLTARELMRRVNVLDTARSALINPYTYQIIPSSKDKVRNRQTLVNATVDVLETMILEFENEAIDTYIRARNLERTTNSPETKVQAAQEASGETRESVDDQSGSRKESSGDNYTYHKIEALVQADRESREI